MSQRALLRALPVAGALLLCGLVFADGPKAPPKADKADEPVKITTPQQVRLYFANNRAFVGTLLEVTNTDVAFQLNIATAKMVRYKVEEIKAIEAGKDDDIYYFDPKKKQWDSVRTAAARKEKEDKLSPFEKKGPGAKKLPDQKDLIYRVAEGVGPTQDKAVQAAEADAVRQAILGVLDSFTLVEKQKELDEKVFPDCGELARGRSRVLKRNTEETRVTVRVGVSVSRKEIVQRLDKAGIKVSDKLRGLAAKLPSKGEIRRHAAEYLQAALADYLRAFTVEAIPGDVSESRLTVHIRITADLEAYDLAMNNLVNVLEAVKRDKNGKAEVQQSLVRTGPTSPRYRTDKPLHRATSLTFESADEWGMWVLSDSKDDWGSVTWQQYIINVDQDSCLAPLLGRLGVEVYVVGVDGSMLASDVVTHEPPPGAPETFWKWGVVEVKNATDNRRHIIISPVGLQLQALRAQHVVDCKVFEEYSSHFIVGPVPETAIRGLQTRLVLIK
jgi:hypothetical protein